jgi:signal transduction histidine kinase
VMSGQTFGFPDFMVPLDRNGYMEDCYFDFSYSPIRDEEGHVGGVLVICVETTEKVLSLRRLKDSYESQQNLNEEVSTINEELTAINEELTQSTEVLNELNENLTESERQVQFAIEAANLGTWDLDPATQKFSGNDRLKYWFGLKPSEHIDLSNATDVIAEKDRPRVLKAIEEAMDFRSGGNYNIEYAIINPDDTKPRHVVAKGKALFNDRKQAIRFSGTLQDITEQKLDDLRKNAFISMVSHELKTPLTSLKGYVQMLKIKAGREGDSNTVNILSKAERQVNKMTTMINGFLNVSRFESGKIYLQIQQFNLEELIKEVIEETILFYPNHFIELFPCTSVAVNADREKVAHVIANLLSNAAKYSAEGGTIKVKCELTKHTVQISIKDEGIGIAPQDIERLFERYYRVESTQQVSGFGIGLYLSAEIIQSHKGQIWVESEPGKGSTFWFTLPIQ